MKTLIVLRHGHAEAFNKASDLDFDRNLDERGRAEVKLAAVGIQTVAQGNLHIIASAASRTQQTSEILASEVGCSRVDFRKSLYSATEDDWIALIPTMEDDVDTVVFVGHNPAVSWLCSQLSRNGIELGTAEWRAFTSLQAWKMTDASTWRPLVK